jgi:hypothetical protein
MEEELCFEIFDNGNFIRLTSVKVRYPDATTDWDKNWIDVKIEVKAGPFTGAYSAQILTVDFKAFRKGLATIYDNLNGHAIFEDIEGYLKINIEGDGIGHFGADCIACNKPGCGAITLNFELHFDQTQIMPMIRQLDAIMASFPMVGNIWNN